MALRSKLLAACVVLGAVGCGPEVKAPSSKPEFVIGSLLTGSGASDDSMKMAIDEVNASGLLPVKLVGTNVGFGDNDDRTELARTMFTTQKVKAIITSWSSTGLKVLRLTNAPEFQNVVQCSSSSTNTTINDPTQPDQDGLLMADKNDTFYRAVANDKKQALLLWQQVKAKGKAGIYWLDDPYGQSFRAEIVAHAAGSLTFDQSFPETFSLTAERAKIDAILAANAAGNLDTLVLVDVGEVGGAILKALVEARPAFHGQIIGPDGIAADSMFVSQGAAFAQWLQVPGNSFAATQPEALGGANSQAWASRFDAAYPQGTSGSTTYDCVYTFALSMLYGRDAVTDETLRQNMAKLKASQMGASPVVVGPSKDGLAAAAQAISEGKHVRYDGASGVIEFDDTGDSIHQLYAVLKVSGTGPFTWAPDQVWDPTTGACVSGCAH